MHEKLWKIVRRLDTDYEPYDKAERDGSDCSCGCRHFVKLAGDVGNDWGVCSNPESPRAGLLTFEHQGCSAFEAMTLDPTFTDAQLRNLIGQASEILKDRRRDRIESTGTDAIQLPDSSGEFYYDVRTSYFPHISGHFPTIFRLERHEGGFVPVRLEAKVGGKQRPRIEGRFPAKNGEVFKIVRGNGEYSYQVPFNGTIYNLKQRGDLSRIGLADLETLRPFCECMETEMFQKIVTDAEEGVGLTRRWLDESRDRLRRWRNREFMSEEAPANKAEYREMLKDEEQSVADSPNRIIEAEAFVEWLKGVDRSNPTLASVPCPEPSQKPSGKRLALRGKLPPHPAAQRVRL